SIVQYPISSAASPRSLYYLFWQAMEGHPDTNPAATSEAQAFAAQIASPDDPAAGAALHRAGIDYAVVHTNLPPQTTQPYQPGLPDDALPWDAGSVNPWFRPVARTSDAVIYRVLPAPRPNGGAVVRPGAGFDASEREGDATARWLLQPRGHMT